MEWKRNVHRVQCETNDQTHSFNIYVLIWYEQNEKKRMMEREKTKMKRKVLNCKNDLRQQWTEFIWCNQCKIFNTCIRTNRRIKFIQTIDKLTENNVR